MHRLACRAFDEIVLGGEQDEATRAGVEPRGDVAKVRAGSVFSVGEILGNPDEWLVRVGGFERGEDRLRRNAGRGFGKDRRVDAAIHRRKVRRERNNDRAAGSEGEFLLDLGEVPVFGQAVGTEAFVAFAVEERGLGLASRPAHSAGAGNDDLGGIDQFLAEQWHERQENCGGIAARGADEFGGLDFGAVQPMAWPEARYRTVTEETKLCDGVTLIPTPGHTAGHLSALLALPDGRRIQRLVETNVTFQRLTEAQMEDYIASGEWQGKAGAYAIQGRAEAFTRFISGSHSNVVGLPLFETAQMLRGIGWLKP